MIKVSFFTEVSKELGRGHLMRTLVLYNYFMKKNHEVILFIEGDINKNDKILKNINFNKSEWRSNFKSINWKNINKSSEILIFDSLLVKQDLVDFVIKNVSNKKVFIDDFQRNNYNSCFVVDWTVNAELKYHKHNKFKNNFLMLGLDFLIVRESFYKQAFNCLKNFENNSCLVILGGTDASNIMEILDEKLFNFFPSIKFKLINSDSCKINSTNTIIFGWQDETSLVKLINESDFVISAAGQTLYELLILNKKTFPICVAENQMDDINNLVDIGFIDSYYSLLDCGWVEKLITDINVFKTKNKEKPYANNLKINDGRYNFYKTIVSHEL